ncbi:MAG: M14 family metallopeptidase [Bacteroidota bacterium]
MKLQVFSILLILFVNNGCRTWEAKPYDFPKPVDTNDRPITLQDKRIYELKNEGVYADNLFDGARLNDFEFVDDNLFRAHIHPENEPINPSPYYAFRIWSDESKSIQLELKYKNAKHRYVPKISMDGKVWMELKEEEIEISEDEKSAVLSLNISANKLWVAAQEVQNSTHVRDWCEEQARHSDVYFSTIGKSKLGRDLFFLDLHQGEIKGKETIVILGRQHPPEVTGWFAMKAFMEEILADQPLSNAFRAKYRLLVFPLMNPDGVDLGHWRHNAGGIDLNRDWAYYRQPENRQVANFVVKTTGQNKSSVILGLDFHSTYNDIFYTNQKVSEKLPLFRTYWTEGIEQALGAEILEKPSHLNTPVSKNWILTQFGGVGIVYEIGDNTPRDFIQKKGQISAQEMMQLLVYR